MTPLLLITSGFLLVYILLIAYLYTGWWRLRLFQKKGAEELLSITVVVALRNEGHNISALLTDLCQQNYPEGDLEIRLVNDHSTDNTVEQINHYLKHYPGNIPIYLHDNPAEGKKAALSIGIQHSKSAWIVTTDGDCRFPKNWLRTLMGFRKASTRMLLGPVKVAPASFGFGQLQAFEFLSLIGFTASAIGHGHPILANGANLAFERATFLALGGYGDDPLASGDDVLLLHRMQKAYPNSVRYASDCAAMVATPPATSWQQFWQQRIRWASKSKYYRNRMALVMGGFLALFNVLLVLLVLCWPIVAYPWPYIAGILGIKLSAEILFIFPMAYHWKQVALLGWAFPFQIFNPLYITFVGIRSIGGGFYWKGRKHRA